MIVVADPSHPGEVLEELFLGPLGMSAGAPCARRSACRGRVSSGW